MTDELTRLRAENARLREAVRPFARIRPSSLYAEDGSDGDRYSVELADRYDFTGADLARARAEMGEE
jgi:hypothetical protein